MQARKTRENSAKSADFDFMMLRIISFPRLTWTRARQLIHRQLGIEQAGLVERRMIYEKRRALEFLEKVSDFFAGRFSVVDGNLGGLIGAFADVLGRNDRVVAYDLEGMFRSIRGFYHNRLAIFTHVGHGAIDSVQAALADFLHFDGGLFPAFRSVVSNYFSAFSESVKGVF